jgi:hypothetical protein
MALVTPATLKPAAAPRQSRMTLAGVVRGKQVAPYRVLIHGVDGVGKSTFGADAPLPIFLGAESGTNHLDVARFPSPEGWLDILDAVQTLTTDPGEFKTLVIDSVDWVEPMIWKYVCETAGVPTIEEVGGGYGKGYTASLDLWRQLLAALERLQRTQGLHVVLIGHSFIKAFKNPEGEDWERYILKLNDKAAGLLREWCEGVFFANYRTFAVAQKGKRTKGVSDGSRMLYTQRTAAFDAKDRYGLPDSMPLSWEEFDKAAVRGEPAKAVDLVEVIKANIPRLPAELQATAQKALDGAGTDATKLSKTNSWINTKLGMTEQEGN